MSVVSEPPSRWQRWRTEGRIMFDIALPIVGANLLGVTMGMTVRRVFVLSVVTKLERIMVPTTCVAVCVYPPPFFSLTPTRSCMLPIAGPDMSTSSATPASQLSSPGGAHDE